MARNRRPGPSVKVEPYEYPEKSPMRPDVGTQAQFKKRKPPHTYRYDPSLSPALDWDEQNAAREEGEALIRGIFEAETLEQAKAAAADLSAMSRPFLNWAGKAERLSFEVPTLPLFVHERLSTMAIIETLKGHKLDPQLDLFNDPRHSVTEQVLGAYEYMDDWVNRMILGDSLVVMNSLLRYERLGGQVQMIYMDPPYGVRFGSNFQPFVRSRDVKHNEDADMTREPEVVQAYRDTWELGLHSYLTYLRDRLLPARDLLSTSGSIFVQISDENVHHVRELLDEVFGAENFVSLITFQTTSGFETTTISAQGDYLLWYAKDAKHLTAYKLFEAQPAVPGGTNAAWLLMPDGSYKGVSAAQKRGEVPLPEGARLYNPDNLLSQGAAGSPQPFRFGGQVYEPPHGSHWKANYPEGMERLAAAGRIHIARSSLRYRRFADDFPFKVRGNIWTDTITGSFTDEKIYAVQTNTKVVERCLLLTTRPGDLVLDPTCGSGTTAYVAEYWGRRWITIDTSRVPLALARQRLLTATFPWFELGDESRGPAGGFIYKRRVSPKGEEQGGIVPHITLRSIANDEPPIEEVLVDRPEEKGEVTRVSGPFWVEATIPAPLDWDGEEVERSAVGIQEDLDTFADRMLEVLRRTPVLRLEGNRTVTFKNVRLPAKTLSLSAEALVDAPAPGQSPSLKEVVQEAVERNVGMLPLSQKPVAFVFGPENGAVSEKLVYEAAREAYAKGYSHLYVIGFAVQPNARMLIERSIDVVGISATYVQATPDLLMGDLLKNMRSSHIFSVCGLPEIRVTTVNSSQQYQVQLVGMDVFDPVTMEASHRSGDDVPAWFLDTDYNGLCFHVSQAFFPRTSAWDNLKRALKGEYDDSVWEHLSGALSAPFEAGEHKQIAVKVIDDRGNELMVVNPIR
jgi:adenine-specific DNA-methyltransferase